MIERREMAEKILRLLPNFRNLISLDGLLGNGDMVSPVQLSTLIILKNDGPQNMTCLAKRLGSSKPNMTMLINRMERSGLVAREMSTDDKRVTNIVLTEKAEEYLKKGLEPCVELLYRKLNLLTAEELERTDRALEDLNAIVNKLAMFR